MTFEEDWEITIHLQEKPMQPVGVYFHIPFCPTLCDFCAFYKNLPDRERTRDFLVGMQREYALRPPGDRVGTIFWGGGTPTLLHPDQIEVLGGLLPPCGSVREWTVEGAPASINRRKLEILRDLGVTRLSIGVQSLQPRLLEMLGRHHSREQAVRAYETARAVGFDSVNLDLMFALPGQTMEDLRADLRALVDLAPDHISTYCLTFEEDTALWVRLAEGRVRRDIDLEAELYRCGWETLEDAGYRQYEISNFARPGFECIHNQNTWMMGDWFGYGPSASSQEGGWRYTNTPDLDRWKRAVLRGDPEQIDRVVLNQKQLASDRILFGLRMTEGIEAVLLECADFDQEERGSLEGFVGRLTEAGLAERVDSRIRLTFEGRLRCDAISVGILECLS